MGRNGFSRRGFLAAGVAWGFPAIIPSRVLGSQAPSKKIQVGVIGCGRIAGGMDIPGLWHNQDLAVPVALADCDIKRLNTTRAKTARLYDGDLPDLKLYQDYRALLADKTVDAVMICTPDFWHAQQCVEAAFAGKDVYVQKPLAMSVFESRTIVDVMRRTGRVFHIGTQQRSEGKSTFGPQFRKAAEYVRNGRLGRVRRVEIGLPQEPEEPADWPLVQPVPDTLDYDQWLGYTPAELYSELRTHPQGKGAEADFGRPGWMTLRAYSMGMIANWGAHHIDIAHWGLDLEETGPIRIRGRAEFPKRRLWDVHGSLDMRLTYANGTELHIADNSVYPNGVRFIGEKGWIFCGRGSVKTLSNDPGAGGKHGRWRPLEASTKALIEGEVERPLPRNPGNHHRVWLECIRTRQPAPILPESAHRTTTACILAFTAMNLKRGLKWDPVAERFVGDDEANATLARPERAPYGVRNALRRAGWASG
ncbi:MAG TPA: Gfo/Idh/MocA family oxidoreductase [Kiritimatiellia bacterium]|jgi:predicted dehydrogenase|nr:Gfo/Idh/MocA family oxidoreductase [Kiritimatiellia bacterium]HOR97731.1 Gfo/Idh/MocA family oxidoreductase [Kiritimatiellia bacterium]HPW75557.1 Gfo/Idh/MocA family oxidoreductase [Kiritimatiellia bacterium]HRU18942.1 Gfo/Idh/MocA family oxidoreductase [Kiritimatiellia bacterium]